MALHQTIQRVLLVGAHLEALPPAPVPRPPERLEPLIDAAARAHRRFDERAVVYGHRYRSGFWAIYLLSAIAVLCAVLPLALGWDSSGHRLHSFAAAWALAEVGVIGTVTAIFWRGQQEDWQGEWLSARTTAELTGYLPLVAPLLDFSVPDDDANWYLRLFNPGQHLRGADDVSNLCVQIEPQARTLLANAWSDPVFVASYARWAIDVFEGQRRYHLGVAIKQHALLHRVHRITSVLFVLTAIAALTHLIIHTLWLSLLTTFFPALAASLHGALAQSEAYRLGTTSERLAEELQAAIERIRERIRMAEETGGLVGDDVAIKSLIRVAIEGILEEHQDWHLLVRPHNLPLA
jgi:hypothetical protein